MIHKVRVRSLSGTLRQLFHVPSPYSLLKVKGHGGPGLVDLTMSSPYNQESMVGNWERMAGTEEGLRLKQEYDALFGRDPFSGDWQPECELPDPGEMDLPSGNHPRGMDFELRKCLRANLYANVLNHLKYIVLKGRNGITAGLLDPGRYVDGMDLVPVIRQHLIWPYFGSVKGFHEHLLKYNEDIQSHCYLIPSSCPSMSKEQLIEYFLDQDDLDGAVLAKLFQLFFRLFDEDAIEDMRWINLMMEYGRQERLH